MKKCPVLTVKNIAYRKKKKFKSPIKVFGSPENYELCRLDLLALSPSILFLFTVEAAH
jgi:hypothetical protein